jgi:hypothetical protein
MRKELFKEKQRVREYAEEITEEFRRHYPQRRPTGEISEYVFKYFSGFQDCTEHYSASFLIDVWNEVLTLY